MNFNSHDHHAGGNKLNASQHGSFETFEFFNNSGGRYKWPQPNGAGAPVNISYALAKNFKLNGLSQGESKTLFQEALEVWAKVAPLNFKEIKDPGSDQQVDIRAKSEFIDGNSNTLGFAFFPQGGDITFDSGERSWSPSLFLETSVHELGHALGLGHDNSVEALMNSQIKGRFNGPGTAFLLPDDIRGIQSLYGNGQGSVTPLEQSPNPRPNPDVNLIKGNQQDNRLLGTRGDDKILGFGGNDRLIGDFGADTLSGGAGRDRLVGNRGNDVLAGGADRDILIGTRPSDTQPGNGELDTLNGGAGADRFVLGTQKKIFYADATALSDYALVEDFDPRQGDILQLKGQASDYSLGISFNNVPDGVTLAQGQGANRELIAVIQSPVNFSLNRNTVRFV